VHPVAAIPGREATGIPPLFYRGVKTPGHTVKTFLGHKRIETTQRYLHLVPAHAERAVRAAQDAEREELEQLTRTSSGRHLGDTTWAEVETQVGENVLTC